MYRSSLQLHKFDPRGSLKKPFNMVILGHKHTGKSTLMRDILWNLHCNGFPRVVVFSGTEEGNEFYSSCIPSAYIHHGLDLDRLRYIVDTQRRVVTSCKQAGISMDCRLVIVLDDLMYKRQVTRTELFGELFMNGRHWQITLILTCQYIMLLDIACRGNTDYLICLRETIPKNRQKIYENYFGMFTKKSDFFHVLDSCTQDYECLVLDNTQPNTDIEKCIHWYKALIDIPPFIFGGKRFQVFSDQSQASA